MAEHVACGYSYVVVGPDGKASKPDVFRGADAIEHFLCALVKEKKSYQQIL